MRTLAALALALSLVACGKSKPAATTPAPTEATESAAPDDAATDDGKADEDGAQKTRQADPESTLGADPCGGGE